MQDTDRGLLYWTPRSLGILFALFVSVFALDVFGAGYSAGRTFVALLMHLIPTALVVVALVVGWRREWLGAILFAALGLWYVILVWGDMHWSAYVLISSPLFLIAALFLAGWLSHRDGEPGA